MNLVEFFQIIVPSAIRKRLSHFRYHLRRRKDAWFRIFREESIARRIRHNQPIVSVPLGKIRLYVDVRDRYIGRGLFVNRHYEPDESNFIRGMLQPGNVFIDIGANVGYYTTLAAGQVGPTGRVLAVEPEPYNFELLRRNIKANQLTNVSTANVALDNKSGKANLYCSSSNFGDHRLYCESSGQDRTATSVTTVRLDDLVNDQKLPHVDLIKMDVQGFECSVLAGMQDVLLSAQELCVLSEFWPYGMEKAGGDPRWFFDTFEKLGFSAHSLTPAGLGPMLSYADALALLPPFDSDSPDGCFINLVFIRRGG